jgi:predicted enzyme related to lactoylglutathione lyase
VLIADHRPAGSVLPIYAVDDLTAATDDLVAGGWQVELGPMGTPEGDATALIDPTGAAIALLEVTRPGAMDAAYADEANTRAVR